MDKIPFKATEKYRYGLRKTVSKYLKRLNYLFLSENITGHPRCV